MSAGGWEATRWERPIKRVTSKTFRFGLIVIERTAQGQFAVRFGSRSHSSTALGRICETLGEAQDHADTMARERGGGWADE